jgi:glyoxylase-like metal-dependent hydrolase (beta-lactamase superfamily II)
MNINRFILGMLSTNCYIISNPTTKEAIIVDPADDAKTIADFLQNEEMTLVGILLTHGHIDHINAAKELAINYKTKIYAGTDEKVLLEDPQTNLSIMIAGKAYTLTPDVLLKDGEVFDLAGFPIEVIHTPGHTCGGVCYLFREYDILVSGDTLFQESVGRSDFPTGNSTILNDSIKKRLLVLEDNITVLPGHGDTTTIGHEKQYNGYIV